MGKDQKPSARQERAQLVDKWRRENGLYPHQQPEAQEARKRRQAAAAKKRGKQPQHKEPPRHRTAEKTNAKGEKILVQYGTTKASKRNPVRLTDGMVHPVNVDFAKPHGPTSDLAE
jgi:hypothetical protein